MPRSVPFWALSELLTWTKRVTSWCAANSCSQKARAKKPRSSPRFSRSIRYAPGIGVSVKIMMSSCQPSRWNRFLSVRRRTNWSPSKSFLPKPCSTILRCSSSMPVARLYWSLKSGRSW